MILTAGIDVGTSAVKVALVESPENSGRERPGSRVVTQVTERIRRRDPRVVVRAAWDRALEESGVKRPEVAYVASTGEGELVEVATGHFYGMTAHARGAVFLAPDARAVVDAGALHGRAIRFDARAKVLDYRMTSQCASGSGQFLENIARYLGVVLDEVGPMSLRADSGEKISSICAVLAETDVINMVSRGISMPNILKGIHDSMGIRFVKLLKSIKAEGVVLVTGGLSRDVGLVASMQQAAKKERLDGVVVATHPDGAYAGALGAALWGAYRFERLSSAAAA